MAEFRLQCAHRRGRTMGRLAIILFLALMTVLVASLVHGFRGIS